MKTIKIILLLFCIILGLNAKAQTVGYTYKALAAEGCNMKYSVAKQDTIYSIIATVRSDRMNFLAEPTMKIRTFTGKYLELRGTVIGNGSQSACWCYKWKYCNPRHRNKFYCSIQNYSTAV